MLNVISANAATLDPTVSFTNAGDALSYGIGASVFGIAVVFGVLILLWAILAVFGMFFKTKKDAPKAEKAPAPAPAPAKSAPAAPSVPETPVAAVATPIYDNNEIIAAITAAISAYRSANGENGGFRVVSFRKR